MLDSNAITSQIFGRISRANQKIGTVISDYNDYIRYVSYSPENNTTLDDIFRKYNPELVRNLTKFKIELSDKVIEDVYNSIRAFYKNIYPKKLESKTNTSQKTRKRIYWIIWKILEFIGLSDLASISLKDLLIF